MPQKRTSSTSKHEISLLFEFLQVIFVLLNPDPAIQINTDPYGSGSENLAGPGSAYKGTG
jgi:hypothetical protein